MSVLLDPEPAIIGTRPFVTLTTVLMTMRSSSSLIAGVSPVVPQGTRPWMPLWIWNSTIPSRASTSTSPFLNGVTIAVKAPLNISLLQLEVSVEAPNRLLHPSRGYHASYLYLRRRNHAYRDARLAQRSEHPGRVTGAVEHPGPDHRDLAQVFFSLGLAAEQARDLAGEPP